MSLINKMLQDLDARGGAAEATLQQQELKAVPVVERDRGPLLLVAGATAALLVVVAGGWFGWRYWQGHQAPPGPVPQVIDNRIPDRPRLQEPPAASASMPPVASASVQPVAAAPVPAAVVPAPKVDVEPTPPAAVKPGPEAHVRHEPVAREQAAEESVPRPVKRAAAHADGKTTQELTPKQVAENTYRRALLALQEGRTSVALADLDKAVEVDPRNDAARQTYISLLLENKRNDDAIRQLRLALGIDPRQPGLAMVLARLQLERGGPALDTLMKTLPYAGDNANYQAFLAGVLQREQRHADAAQYYRSALKLSPLNGVWWMGLGISLQADGQLPEARDAFNHARASNGLTPELQGFVTRKLEQLAR